MFAKHISDNNYKVGVDFIPESENTKKNFNKFFQYDLNKGFPADFEMKKVSLIIFYFWIFLNICLTIEKILNDSKNILNKDGKIIVSLPNFANIYVRLNLLFGRLPLADKGILDRTHLHLFTYRIIKKLLKKYKFTIVEQKIYSYTNYRSFA